MKDSGGTFRSLCDYPGFNALKGIRWGERIDDPHATFDAELLREQFGLNLSPFRQFSALNHAFDPANSFAALIALNREVKIEVAVTPLGKPKPNAGDWMEVFRGRIDTVDPGAGKLMRIGGRSLGGRLAQQYIKQERVYSFATVAGVAVPLVIWQPGLPVTTSPLIYVLPASRGNGTTPDPGYNKFLKCTQAGTTGTTEPVWTTGTGQVDGTAKWDYVGTPTTAGTAVEQVIQNILDDNKGTGDPTVTLYTPVSPGWAITQFQQDRGFTLDAIRKLALQIGWDLRYKWKAASSSFELTLYQPTRSSPTVAFTFHVADYLDPTAVALDIAEIRNSWRIIYSDAASLDPTGTPLRKVIDVNDSASVTKYGELWAEIQEDSASQIDTSTEATTLVNAALSDCKEPTAAVSIPLAAGFPWVELNDYYTFDGNNQAWDGGSLAVTEYHHSFEAEMPVLKTALACRGLPTIGASSWIGSTLHSRIPDGRKPHRLVHFDGTETASISTGALVGGAQLQLTQKTDKVQLPKEYEVHVYSTPSTALDSTTLATVTSDLANLVVKGLIPGKTYYRRVVPRWRNAGRPVRSQPGVETSFVATQAVTGHISSFADVSRRPLNGDFQNQFDPSAPPDHWTLTTGTWGTIGGPGVNVGLSTGLFGDNAVQFTDVAVARSLDSDVFLVEPGMLYKVSAWFKQHSAISRNGLLRLTWLDSTKAAISNVDATRTATTNWNKAALAAFAPSNAAFAKISLLTNNGATASGFDVDGVEIRQLRLTGQLLWGNSAPSAAAVTHYMTPGGGAGATDANERKWQVPGDCVLTQLFARARVASTGVQYVITLRQNGVDTAITATLAAAGVSASDVSDLVIENTNYDGAGGGNDYSLKIVSTLPGGGPVAATDLFVTLGIWQA